MSGSDTLIFGCQVGGKCLWFNESAPHVSTDMFIVQGAPGVWDMHCQYEASGPGVGQFPDLVSVRPQIPIPSLHAFANLTSCGKPLIEDLSGQCSAHGNFFFIQYQCAQYQDHCLKTIMRCLPFSCLRVLCSYRSPSWLA